MKKNKMLRIIILLFLILFSVLELIVISHYINNFINGFTPLILLGMRPEIRVYGFQAIDQDAWTHLIAFPIIHLASAFQYYTGIVCKGNAQKSVYG